MSKAYKTTLDYCIRFDDFCQAPTALQPLFTVSSSDQPCRRPHPRRVGRKRRRNGIARPLHPRRAQIERRGEKHRFARPADYAAEPRRPAVRAHARHHVVHRRQRRRTGKRTKQHDGSRLARQTQRRKHRFQFVRQRSQQPRFAPKRRRGKNCTQTAQSVSASPAPPLRRAQMRHRRSSAPTAPPESPRCRAPAETARSCAPPCQKTADSHAAHG